jgi:hypothetical protein
MRDDMPQNRTAWAVLLVGGGISQAIAGLVTDAALVDPSTWATRSALRLAIFAPLFFVTMAVMKRFNGQPNAKR